MCILRRGKTFLYKIHPVAFDGSNLTIVQKKKTIRLDGLFSLELLARFELATSSLPRIQRLRL